MSFVLMSDTQLHPGKDTLNGDKQTDDPEAGHNLPFSSRERTVGTQQLRSFI